MRRVLVFFICASVVMVALSIAVPAASAGSARKPLEVEVADVSRESFSVSWWCHYQTPAALHWGDTPSLGNETPFSLGRVLDVHRTKISGLNDDTTYYFMIETGSELWGDNGTGAAIVGGVPWQVTTAPISGMKPSSHLIFGRVLDASGENATLSVVYLFVKHSGIPSLLLTSKVKQDGRFSFELSELKKEDLSIFYWSNGDPLRLRVQGAGRGVYPDVGWDASHAIQYVGLAPPPQDIGTFTLGTYSPPGNLSIYPSGDDINITWNMSGSPEIVSYNVYVSNEPDGFDIGSPNASTTSTNWSHASALSTGQDWFYMVRGVDASGVEDRGQAVLGRHRHAFQPGWNLFSVPLAPANRSLSAVLGDELTGGELPTEADRVLSWDAANSRWLSAYLYESVSFPQLNGTWVFEGAYTFELNESQGYWVCVRDDLGHPAVELDLFGVASNGATAEFSEGWNLFGLSSFQELTLAGGTKDTSGLYDAGLDGASFPTQSDRLLAYDGGGWKVQYLYASTDYPQANGTWMGEDVTLSTGAGYWLHIRPGNGAVVWDYRR